MEGDIAQNPNVESSNNSFVQSIAKEIGEIKNADFQDIYEKLLCGAESAAVSDWHSGDARERRYCMMSYKDTSLHEHIQNGRADNNETMIENGVVFPAV